jgi:hypothetical protein
VGRVGGCAVLVLELLIRRTPRLSGFFDLWLWRSAPACSRLVSARLPCSHQALGSSLGVFPGRAEARLGGKRHAADPPHFHSAVPPALVDFTTASA